MKPLIRAFTLASSLLLTPWAMAADGLPVAPFQARYEVYASGFSIGEAVITLIATGPGAYQMSSDVRPNGLVALLASGRIHEQVSGQIRNGAIRPLQYERRLDTGSKSNHMQLRFDWSAGQVQARYNSEQATLPLAPGVVDPLSLQLVVIGDLKRGQTPSQYSLVDKTEIKTYQIRNQGEETLDTPLGPLRTVRINQYTPGKTRMTTFWVAPGKQYLLARIAQEKNGKEEVRMEIRAVDY
ncbi:MAG: DUF3108 domain-containing protein [Candidatus Competibacter sp.]|nr:DUF3108 domain-containing protein [Candidatus Competibacter sp.]MDG4604562.1 DUF3108 domain-containing protein [Candidatus Contendobacter sp.]HRD48226.1 DUF3108 domain-containing protein [Candidatus Contendobacter sp.]